MGLLNLSFYLKTLGKGANEGFKWKIYHYVIFGNPRGQLKII